MNNSFAFTFYFKEIFPNFETFKAYLTQYNIRTQTESDTFDLFIYNNLFNMFCNSNVNYDTIDAFKRHFAIELLNIYRQYLFKYQTLDEMYKLSIDDLNVIQYGINNVALNDNTKILNPLDNLVEFVSSQTSDKTRANKLASYITAVRDIADMYIFDFLDKFKKHFMQIIPTAYDVYKKGE